jgi:hypothetical protein
MNKINTDTGFALDAVIIMQKKYAGEPEVK